MHQEIEKIWPKYKRANVIRYDPQANTVTLWGTSLLFGSSVVTTLLGAALIKPMRMLI